MTQASARINDEELAEWLDGRENKSETVREALRYLRLQREGIGDKRLTDAQRAAYEWFRQRVGVGGSIPLGPAKSKLSQQVGLKKEDLRYAVFGALERLGYIEVTPRMHDVVVSVRAPDDADAPEAATEVDDSAERMDALAEAAEDVAGVAD